MNLVSDPTPLEGQLCLSNVRFTCNTVQLSTIRWFLSGSQIIVHSFNNGNYPLLLSGTSIPSGVTLMIQNAEANADDETQIDFVSTLDTNLTHLLEIGVTSVSCGSLGHQDAVAVSYTIRGIIIDIFNKTTPIY